MDNRESENNSKPLKPMRGLADAVEMLINSCKSSQIKERRKRKFLESDVS